MAVVVIENGVINCPSLEALEHDEEWLDKELNRLGQKLDEVFLAEVHEQKLWVYPDVKKASGDYHSTPASKLAGSIISYV